MASMSSTSGDEMSIKKNADMPTLEGMIKDLCRSSASPEDSNNINLNADNPLGQALLDQIHECQKSVEETDNDSVGHKPDEGTSNPIIDPLNSSGKCFSFVINRQTASGATGLGEPPVATPTDERASEENINNAGSYTASSAAPDNRTAATLTDSNLQPPRKKQHIMISYNRSSIETCRKIRDGLKGLKYKVWMDLNDMHDNIIEGMARAIENSYIVLICISQKYYESNYCRKEAEYAAEKHIKLIPCFMETPFPTENWLGLLKGANLHIDFSKSDEFVESFEQLIREITFIENKLSIWPRQTPPVTPTTDLYSTNTFTLTTPTTIATPNPNLTLPAHVDTIIHDFKKSIILNRHNVKRLNQNEVNQLLDHLRQIITSVSTLTEHSNISDETGLFQLLLTPSRDQNEILLRITNGLTKLTQAAIKLILLIMALWAVKHFIIDG